MRATRTKPLEERRAKLKRTHRRLNRVRYSAELAGSADAVLKMVRAAGLEGIVAKKRDSPYRAGTRVTIVAEIQAE